MILLAFELMIGLFGLILNELNCGGMLFSTCLFSGNVQIIGETSPNFYKTLTIYQDNYVVRTFLRLSHSYKLVLFSMSCEYVELMIKMMMLMILMMMIITVMYP